MGAPGLTKPSETLEDRDQVPISGNMGEKPRNLGIETGKRWDNVEKNVEKMFVKQNMATTI